MIDGIDIFYLPYFLALISPGLATTSIMRRYGWIDGPAGQQVLGYTLGYAWAIFSTVLFMRFGLSTLFLACGSAGVALALYLLIKPTENRNQVSFGSFVHEYRWDILFGLAAIALTVLVIMRVGFFNGSAHVFTTLFVNDYFNHLAVTAELAKNVPPTNIYFEGLTAHYYWFFHVLPASFHRLTELQVSVRSLLLWQDCLNILMLFISLGYLLRRSGVSRRASIMSLSLVLFFYSYIDLFIIGRALGNMISIAELVPSLGPIWQKIESFSGLSHSYMRDFWVEPHAVTAVLLSTAAVSVHCFRNVSWRPVVRGLILGCFVFAAFGCDSFLGTILAIWIGLDVSIDFVKGDRALRKDFLQLSGGVAITAVVALTYIFGLDMIGGQKGLLQFTPMTGVIATLPFYLALDYGPIFLFGLAGWWLLWRGKLSFKVNRLWLLGAVALVMGLFLRHAVEYDILLRKSGKPLQLVLLIGAGVFFEQLTSMSRRTKNIVTLLLLLALPAVLFDIQAFGGFGGSRGLENYIEPRELRAVEWVRNNTPVDAIVQGQPGYQGEYLYEFNPIPPLAERPVAVGTYMMSALWGVGGKAALTRIHAVDSLFQAETAKRAAFLADSLNIDFLFIGPREKKKYQPNITALINDTVYFEKVYNEDSVTILRYRDDSYSN